MVLFDTHTHINDERFDEDRSAVIENMRRAGVQLAVVVGDAAAQPESAFALAVRRRGRTPARRDSV